MLMTALKAPFRVLAFALVLGWITDMLFYKQELGVSVLLFLLFLLGSITVLARLEQVSVARRNLWLLEPLLFFAGMIVVRANDSLTLMNIMAVAVLLGLLIFFFAADRIERLGVMGYPVVLATAAWRMLSEPVPAVNSLALSAGNHKERVRAVLPILRGLLIALPLLIVFTLLLASADVFFAGYVNDVMQLQFLSDAPDLLLQLALIFVAAWLSAGAAYFALSRGASPAGRGELYELPGVVHINKRLGASEAFTVLVLVNILFAVFAWTQFVYLFSGEAERTMNYAAYRDYVRQGFGQLLFVSVLAMGVILGLRWLVRLVPGRAQLLFNALSTGTILLTLVMLASAFWRMLAWENIQFYINTPLRIYVRVFILFLALSFCWLLFTMWFKRERFAIGALVVALGFLMTVNIINPDADVAAYNLAHRDDELATRYLSLLSDDAVPALVQGLQSGDVQGREAIHNDLQRRLDLMRADTGRQNWQAFNLARRQAFDLLENLAYAGQLSDPAYTGRLGDSGTTGSLGSPVNTSNTPPQSERVGTSVLDDGTLGPGVSHRSLLR